MRLERPRLIRAGVIGYGRVGKTRARCACAGKSWELIGICDTDRRQADGDGVPFHHDWKQLLRHKPEALFVCTTNRHIPDIVVAALSRGIHVFCEKPPGRSFEDARRMRAAEQARPGIKLKFGFNHRYHESVREARAIVDSGRLGRVLWIRGIYGKGGGPGYDRNWRNKREISGGGILIDQGIHMLDLCRHFCGDFESVKSFITRSYWPLEVEDNAFALLRNRRGQVAMVHSSSTQWQHRFCLEIYLERGYLSITGFQTSTQTYGRETLTVARCAYDAEGYPLPNPQESVTYYDQDRSWQLEVDDFARCILEDKPVIVGTSEDACAAMDLVQRIYAADEEWRWPTAGPRRVMGVKP